MQRLTRLIDGCWDHGSRLAPARNRITPQVMTHISSHWEYYLRKGGGFERLARNPHLIQKVLTKVERWSYASSRLRNLETFSELESRMLDLLKRLHAEPNFLSFRTTCAAAIFTQRWQRKPDRLLVIGDGQGLMGAFMKWMFSEIEVISVDLAPMLDIQKELYRQAGLSGRFVEPALLETIQQTDCAFNMASMQEMPHAEIIRYFAFLRSSTALFYCVNRQEKRLIGGEVLRFNEYPWSEKDVIWIDEPCWFYTHFFSHRPPFLHQFDGPMWHRLALLR